MKSIIDLQTKKPVKRNKREPSQADLSLDEYQHVIAARYREMVTDWLAFAYEQAKAVQQHYPGIPNWEFSHRAYTVPHNPSEELLWWARTVSEKFPSAEFLLSVDANGMTTYDTGKTLEELESEAQP